MPELLLLRLEGPLQAWGTRARWDVRDTAPEPTKSAVIGLLGAALGYAADDPRLFELAGTLRMGVRVDHPGTVMTDFQTITDFLPTAGGEFKASGEKRSKRLDKLQDNPDARPATILSPRDYLEDASFLVVLEQADGGSETLERCRQALRDPVWPMYLGRKACVPTRPVLVEPHEIPVLYSTLIDALEHHPWSHSGPQGEDRTPPHDQPGCDIFAEEGVSGLQASDERIVSSHERQDVPHPNRARFFHFRRVFRLKPVQPPLRQALYQEGGAE
ncbi:type I-E CRISPR-associated protein Cas5/CasD [bacterium]|nr:type I-E CRISPR-associated protein Cas5/CasD [bacterium]